MFMWIKNLIRHRFKVGEHVYVYSPQLKGCGIIKSRDGLFPDYEIVPYTQLDSEGVLVQEEFMHKLSTKPSFWSRIKRKLFFKSPRFE